MDTATDGSGRARLTVGSAAVVLGVLAGALALVVATQETRWIIYSAGGVFAVMLLLLVRMDARLAWVAFILALQFDVSIRAFYEYAGSHGLALFFPTAVGLVYVFARLFSDEAIGKIRWTGPFSFSLVAIGLTTIVSLLFSSEHFVGMTEVFTLLQYYFLYLVGLNFVRSEQQLSRTLYLLLVVLTVQSIIYYIQSALGLTFTLTGEVMLHEGDFPRPGGTVSTNPAGFCSFILPLLLIAIASLVTAAQTRQQRALAGIAASLAIGALILTLTRAAWGSFVLGFAGLTLVAYRRRLLSHRQILLIGGFALLVVAIASPIILIRLAPVPLESAYEERYALMQMATQVIQAHPFVGVGPGAYDFAYKPYLTVELANKWQSTVHNHYLLLAAERGILGGMAFVVLLISGLRLSSRLTTSSVLPVRTLALGVMAGLLALSFEMYWDIWRGFTYNALLWLLLGLIAGASYIDKDHVRNSPPAVP